jgi:hypothetical protein
MVSRACRESANQNVRGAVRFSKPWSFQGRQKQSAAVLTRGTRRSLANRLFSPFAPVQNCCFAPHLFVAAMVARVHQGLPRIGQSAFGIREVFRAAKAKRHRSPVECAPVPPVLRFVIPRQRFVHGSHGVSFAPARRSAHPTGPLQPLIVKQNTVAGQIRQLARAPPVPPRHRRHLTNQHDGKTEAERGPSSPGLHVAVQGSAF